ncbi:hypothetical protein V1524DRAFT_425180 [Lipomyces starkeyi]
MTTRQIHFRGYSVRPQWSLSNAKLERHSVCLRMMFISEGYLYLARGFPRAVGVVAIPKFFITDKQSKLHSCEYPCLAYLIIEYALKLFQYFIVYISVRFVVVRIAKSVSL